MGIAFEVMDPDVEELTAGEPRAVVAENALRKARAGAESRPGCVALGCDTEVVLDGSVCGHPGSEDDARAQLQALSGREHEVLSAIALVESSERTGIASAIVRFRALTEEEIERYLATEEWRGRAGGYAIQGFGSALVDRVEGDLTAVIGLPVGLLWELAPELFSQA